MNKIYSILLTILFALSTLTLSAQKVTLKHQNVKLDVVLTDITRQTGYAVNYSRPIVNPDKIVSINVSKVELPVALDRLFAQTDIRYEISDKKIFLVAKNQVKSLPDKKVSGIITDENGLPVIGAVVMLHGTQQGVSTSVDGSFEIDVPSGNDVLDIMYLGYQDAEVKLADSQTKVQVQLEPSTIAMDELVVVGYGVMNKRDVSTSVSSVKAKQLVDVPITDFRQALSGKMPGVQVSQTSGDPEGSVVIRVRGISSVNAGNDPLYVVDGVPMQRGFSNINNNDIESVEVLKDASSAAIYGSRGSNGVILITTKGGKSEKLQVSYDGYVGVQQVSYKIPLMNAYQFAEVAKDAHDNAYLDEGGASPDDPNSIRPQSYHQVPPDLFPYLNGETGLTDTDWQDAIFRNATTTSHNLAFSGRSKTVNYYLSGNYTRKDGIIINSDFEKYSVRMNLDAKYNWIKVGVNFSPSYSRSNRVDASGANGVVQSALMMPPVWPVYNEDGSYNYQGNGYWRIGTDYQHNAVLNPVAMASLKSDVVDRIAMTGKMFADVELFKGLNYNVSLGGDFYGAHNDQYTSSELPLLGYQYYDKPSNPIGYSSSGFYFNWILENKLTFSKEFGRGHSLNVILVQSAQKETYKGNNVTATDYPNDYIQTISGGIVSKGSSDITQWSLASYLARAQYSYKGKYLLSAAIRADGSSRFGKNNRWGYFPSASAAWRMSDEKFFSDCSTLAFIDDLKLRASYGETGNFQIGNYEHLSTMTSDDYILGSGNGSQIPGYKPASISKDDLRWEKTAMVNVGLDIQMLRGLIGLTAEIYNSNTSDMLLDVPVSHLTGYSTSRMNIGKVNNRGIELQLTSQHDFESGFGYGLSANWSRNVNKVIALGASDSPLITTGSVNHAYYITEVGKPIGSYYLLVQDGIFSSPEELKAYPHFDNTKVGDFRFVDIDGDGVMDLDKDRTIVGNYMPDFTYGFSANLHYKGIDFVADFQGVYGNEILNLNRRYIDNMEGNVNGTTVALDRWRSLTDTGNGEVNRANRKSKGYNGRTSTWHIEDGSYLRLQNLTLGYTLPAKISQKISLEKLRLYFSGQNLFTLTNYTGYNPEVSIRSSSATSPGEDYGTYPLARVYTIGMNITF